MSENPASAGADAMNKAMDAFRGGAEEFGKLFAQLRFPGMPSGDAMMEAYKRNVDALTQANRVALEGFQTVARRNMELMQQTMAEVADTMRTMSAGSPAHDKATQQTELLKRAYERAIQHTRELSELIQQTNSEAVSLLNRRFVEAMDEVKGLVAQAKAARPE